MELTVTQHYESRLGPFEKINFEVLNDRYGRITTTRLRKSRNYAIELATLNPKPRQTVKVAWRLLAAGVVTLLGLAGLIYYQMKGSGTLPLPATAGAALLLLALTVLFFRMFTTLSGRRIVFSARFSGIPLVEIPIPVSDRKRGKAFAEVMSMLAQKNRARISHNDDELRAGELRMLRRLSDEGAIASAAYDKAKMQLLRLAS